MKRLAKSPNKLYNNLQKVLSVGFFALVLMGSSFVGVNYVKAQSLQDKIEELQQKNTENKSAVEKLKEVATSYADAIDKLKDEITETEQAIRVSQGRQVELESKITEAEAELEKQKDFLSSNITQMYVDGDISTLEMLASSKDLSEFIDKKQYRDSVSKKITDTLAKINDLKKQLGEQKAQVDVELSQQKISHEQLAIAKNEQSRLLNLNQSEQTEYNANTKANEAKIAEFKKQQEEEARRLFAGNLKSQGPVKQGDILGYVGNTGLSFGAHLHLEALVGSGCSDLRNPATYIANGTWVRPVEGGYTSQEFGNPDSMYRCGVHAGMDIAGVTGRPIRAVADGEIVVNCKGYCGGYGNSIVIRHPNGVMSRYAHMRE